MQVDFLNYVVLSRGAHCHSGCAHLRPLVGVRFPIQRVLQWLRGRDELSAQGHAAAAGLGAKHGGRQKLRLILKLNLLNDDWSV